MRFKPWPLLLLLMATPALASPLDGEWTARYRGDGGGEREAQLTLQGGQGGWRIFSKNNKDKRNPCIGPDWKARAQAADEGAWRLQADGKVLADFCGSLDLLLKPQADGSWEGEWNSAPFRLERKR